jgi:hypothetical protein
MMNKSVYLFKAEKIEKLNMTQQPLNSSIVDCSSRNSNSLLVLSDANYKNDYSLVFFQEYNLNSIIESKSPLRMSNDKHIDCHTIFNNWYLYVCGGSIKINKILDENDDSRFINKGSTYVSICADFDNIRSYILTNIYIKFK